MLYLRKQDYKAIAAHCRRELPNEACGLLGGRVNGADAYVESVFFLTNMDSSQTHFTMEPKEQLAAVKRMRSCGYVLLGNFHSHPRTTAEPSLEDKRLANDRDFRYLILSLMETEPVLKVFYLDIKGWLEEELVIVE